MTIYVKECVKLNSRLAVIIRKESASFIGLHFHFLSLIYSVEGTRNMPAHSVVTFVLEYDKGEWLDIKTVGYDRIPNLKELTTLWEKGEINSSTTGVAPANVSSDQPLQGNKADGIASNQSVVMSGGKVSTLSPEKQGEVAESSFGKRIVGGKTKSKRFFRARY